MEIKKVHWRPKWKNGGIYPESSKDCVEKYGKTTKNNKSENHRFLHFKHCGVGNSWYRHKDIHIKEIHSQNKRSIVDLIPMDIYSTKLMTIG